MPTIRRLQSLLVTWYRSTKRDLPWRNTHDPYAIWVSEIMLQQTRVETVIDYWHRFLKTFPTITSLAKASEDEVMSMWQGLGYYRRARLMHKAAKFLMENVEGELPSTQKELLKLPGFGPYTSGSVASIAFGEKVPCVDGNVTRVLSRVLATHQDVTPFARKLAQHEDPSSINQGLMELGALICTPKNPKCLMCPFREDCQALLSNKLEDFPAPRKKPKVQKISAVAVRLHHEGAFFVTQRSTQGRWAGLWEFPYFEGSSKAQKQFVQDLLPSSAKRKDVGTINHKLTHMDIKVNILDVCVDQKPALSLEGTWTKSFENHPISVLTQKIYQS